ncbi:hypothetical protein F2Q68_00006324 [Brassica cretica]|uniref:Uncharacterized protein n=1 Tax=Brassica cretica TaxID=69181 RepID=A0A8S9JG59_BRACR|nr:hypothetical protein F2Q68_00006324 [Brassica cretica]
MISSRLAAHFEDAAELGLGFSLAVEASRWIYEVSAYCLAGSELAKPLLGTPAVAGIVDIASLRSLFAEIGALTEN